MDVLIFEEHTSVLPVWWSRKTRGRTLVCLDAHLDLQFVNPERLAPLQQCTTTEGVRRLAKPHMLMPDQGYSYSIEDFLYPAHHLGMVDRLVWVAPPHVHTGYSEGALDALRQMDGVVLEDLMSFRRVAGGWIEGRLLGLELAICRHSQLPAMALPANCLVDIDIDYFIAVPGDAAWMNPSDIFGVLSDLPVQPDCITLSRSVNSGHTPLRYRYLADHLAALWEGREQDGHHYERLFHLDRQLQEGGGQSVVAECRRDIEHHPRCAASHYLLSLGEPDPEASRAHSRQAAGLCAEYRPNALRSACEVRSRQLEPDDAAMTALEEQLAASPVSPEVRALAEAALGLVCCARGDLGRALSLYGSCERHFHGHPELALEIGRQLLTSPEPDQATRFLETAQQDDSTRTPAAFYLGQLTASRGEPRLALAHLEAAHQAAPAWGELLLMQSEIHQQLGHLHRSQELWDLYDAQQRQIAQLAGRLGAQGGAFR